MDPQQKPFPLPNEPSDVPSGNIPAAPQAYGANGATTPTAIVPPETPPVDPNPWSGPVAAGVVSPPDGPNLMSKTTATIAPSPPIVVGGPKPAKKRMLIGIIVAAVLLILLGASAAAYYLAMNKPQNILNTALVNSFSKDKIKSAAFEGSLDTKPQDGSSTAATFTGAANQDGAFNFTSKVDALVTTITVDVRSGDGKTFYARVGGLGSLADTPGTGDTAQAAAFLRLIGSLNDQWIQINQSMIKQLTGGDNSFTATLSDADRQKLADAYKKNQFLVVQKSLADESIKGKSSHHYQVVIEKTKLKSFAAAMKAANIQSLKFTPEQLNSFNKQVDQANFSKYPVDIWVAKDGKLIDQVALSMTQEGTTSSLRLTLHDFNKPVAVVVPKSAKSLLDVMNSLMTESLSGHHDMPAMDALSGISL